MRHKTNEKFGFSYRYWTMGSSTNDILHRVDGPALERSDGSKIWIVDGKVVRQEGGPLGHLAGWRVFGGYIVPNPDATAPLRAPKEFQ